MIVGVDSPRYEDLVGVTEVLAAVLRLQCTLWSSGEPAREHRAPVKNGHRRLGWWWLAIGGNWLGKQT